MGAIIEQYKRIKDIANFPIPVSEESSLYQIFYQRKQLCKNIDKAGTDLDQFLELLNQYDEKIKQYLNL